MINLTKVLLTKQKKILDLIELKFINKFHHFLQISNQINLNLETKSKYIQ